LRDTTARKEIMAHLDFVHIAVPLASDGDRRGEGLLPRAEWQARRGLGNLRKGCFVQRESLKIG
jgi:hypothetical protein